MLASDFGVPQDRRRVFIFGLRDDHQFVGDFAQVAAALMDKQKKSAVVTVREALSDLPRGSLLETMVRFHTPASRETAIPTIRS